MTKIVFNDKICNEFLMSFEFLMAQKLYFKMANKKKGGEKR